MFEQTYEQELPIPRSQGESLDVPFGRARVHCDNKIRQVGLNHDYNMTFLVYPVANMVLEVKAARVSFPM